MRKLKNLKHIFAIILISLTVLFACIMMSLGSGNDSINGFFIYRTTGGIWQDYFHTHTLHPSDNIAIIKIDERTINSLQTRGNDLKMLTIPKSMYGEVIKKLEGAGVVGIGFDIVFQNTDEKEEEFVQTMQQYNNIAIASYRYNGDDCIPDTHGTGVTCNGAPRFVYRDIPWGLISLDGPYYRWLTYDISGTPYKDWKGKKHILKTLPLELITLSQYTNTGINTLLKSREKMVLSPFFGKPNVYHEMSFIDVMEMSRAQLSKTFGGKYILIGESGTIIHDTLVSPVTGTDMDGVEIHAHFLDGLLQNKMLTKAPILTIWFSSIILTILTIFCYFFLPTYLSPIFAIVMMMTVLWVSRYLYDIHRILVDILPLFLAVGISTFPITFIYRFFVVDREKRFIENAFGHYIDPKMVEMIDTEEVDVTLGGEQRELSVFFSDIAGFTTISERLSPQDLFYLMSSYLSQMTDVLKREGGTLDKYIGDAVMGFFGAPITQPDHAIRACRTAITMRHILPEFNAEIVIRGILPVDFRVGIATGDVMVGNIGSEEHFNYTVLGDTVNLASRLEATGKEYNVHIIISEGTRSQIGDIFALRELDTIAVKGKTEGIRIYELLGLQTSITNRTIYDIYERALALYRAGEYMDAGRLWETQMERDPASQVMALRCIEIIKGNIQVEDGIYRMMHK